MFPARLFPLLLLVSAAGTTPARAQSREVDRWQITTDSGEYVWDIRLVRLTGDSLIFRQADTLGAMSVAQIRELRLIHKTTVHLGAGEAGAGTMAALTGSDDEVYDFQTLDYPARIRAVQQIFLVHPPSGP